MCTRPLINVKENGPGHCKKLTIPLRDRNNIDGIEIIYKMNLKAQSYWRDWKRTQTHAPRNNEGNNDQGAEKTIGKTYFKLQKAGKTPTGQTATSKLKQASNQPRTDIITAVRISSKYCREKNATVTSPARTSQGRHFSEEEGGRCCRTNKSARHTTNHQACARARPALNMMISETPQHIIMSEVTERRLN